MLLLWTGVDVISSCAVVMILILVHLYTNIKRKYCICNVSIRSPYNIVTLNMEGIQGFVHSAVKSSGFYCHLTIYSTYSSQNSVSLWIKWCYI